jgi:hypothetical protein
MQRTSEPGHVPELSGGGAFDTPTGVNPTAGAVRRRRVRQADARDDPIHVLSAID